MAHQSNVAHTHTYPIVKQLILLIVLAHLPMHAHAGNCTYRTDRAKDGSYCGERSAEARQGGYEPIIYTPTPQTAATPEPPAQIQTTQPQPTQTQSPINRPLSRNKDLLISWLFFIIAIMLFIALFIALPIKIMKQSNKRIKTIAEQNTSEQTDDFFNKKINKIKENRTLTNAFLIVALIITTLIYPPSILFSLVILITANTYFIDEISSLKYQQKKHQQQTQQTAPNPPPQPEPKPTTPPNPNTDRINAAELAQLREKQQQAEQMEKGKAAFQRLAHNLNTNPQFAQAMRQAIEKAEAQNPPPQPESESDRLQAKLDHYINRHHDKAEIGKLYERQVGYFLEQKGFQVIHRGILLGLEDEGIDLIAKKENRIILVQAKNWGERLTIHEKHINQFKGSADCFVSENPQPNVQWQYLFVSSNPISPRATQVATTHRIRAFNLPLDKTFPMIKCKVNKQEKTLIYHLPFDQQYDKIIMRPENGDCRAHTIFEAEFKGFRHAHRWRGNH